MNSFDPNKKIINIFLSLVQLYLAISTAVVNNKIKN